MAQKNAAQRATLTQVAALSGVSVKTASRALNGEQYVATETAARVLSAAAQLGFRVNAVARDFRRGSRSPSVGLLIGDLANPFYARVARGAERRLREYDLRLVSASTEESPLQERALVEEMLDRRMTAIMIVTSSTNHDYVESERRLGTPIVFLDREPTDVVSDTIILDNAGGIEAAVEHLHASGHTRIGLLSYMARLSTSHERSEAFFGAMRNAGLDGHRYVRDDCDGAESAAKATMSLLAESPPPTALIATNNRLTTGVVRALRDSDQRLALIGFDDFDLADVLGVSVIAHDPELMGATAAGMVIQRLTGDTSPSRRLVLPTELIVRSSQEAFAADRRAPRIR